MARTRAAPFVQLRICFEWTLAELLRATEASADKRADPEVAVQRVRRLRIQAVSLDVEAAAAIIVPHIGPVPALRGGGERETQWNDFALLKARATIADCESELHVRCR